jgi:hypothetical protein
MDNTQLLEIIAGFPDDQGAGVAAQVILSTIEATPEAIEAGRIAADTAEQAGHKCKCAIAAAVLANSAVRQEHHSDERRR